MQAHQRLLKESLVAATGEVLGVTTTRSVRGSNSVVAVREQVSVDAALASVLSELENISKDSQLLTQDPPLNAVPVV